MSDEAPEADPHDVFEDLSPKERVEEAHGLWELQVTRVAMFAEMICLCNGQGLSLGELKRVVAAEREAFKNWQETSRECGA